MTRPVLIHMQKTPRPKLISLVVSPMRPRKIVLMSTDRVAMGNPAGLTDKELEVLVWCANGKRLSDIGILMNIRQAQARVISFRMRTKLGAQTIAGAVAIALRRGIIK